MDNDFVSVFDDVIFGATASGVEKAYKTELVPILEKEKQNYAKLLVLKGIDVRQAPSFVGGDWRMLSRYWIDRKGASIGNPRFYYGDGRSGGHLKDALLAMPTEQLFGRTEVMTYIDRMGLKLSRGFTRRGRYIETVVRDAKGRFGSVRLYRSSPVRVSVDPFPNIRTGEATGLAILNQLPIDPAQKLKLKYNAESRPLLSAFTEWFLKTELRAKIKAFKPRGRH